MSWFSSTAIADVEPSAADAVEALLLERVDVALSTVSWREFVAGDEARSVLQRIGAAAGGALPDSVALVIDRQCAEIRNDSIIPASRLSDALLDVRLAVSRSAANALSERVPTPFVS